RRAGDRSHLQWPPWVVRQVGAALRAAMNEATVARLSRHQECRSHLLERRAGDRSHLQWPPWVVRQVGAALRAAMNEITAARLSRHKGAAPTTRRLWEWAWRL
ncbi:MAG: hypothetical protein WD803_08155, partial [Gammaproteobacteria bacterium]